MKGFLFGACGPAGNCAQTFYAIFRVGIGLSMALLHGWQKLKDGGVSGDGFVGAIEGMGLPVPIVWAWAVALTELVGGLLIALGLLTRPAAIASFINMAVAFFVVHNMDPSSEGGGEPALLYALCFLLICSLGAGKYGIDRAIHKG